MPSWKDILEQLAVIREAPIPFLIVTLAIFGIVWFVINLRYSDIIASRDSTIQTLEARIKLRDDQLADKLHSTPPNEAQAIIKGLQDRIDKISPRRLDNLKRTALLQQLKLPPGVAYQIDIMHDGACSDCNLFAADFSTLFKESGWAVRNGMVIGPGQLPPSGVGIIVENPSALSEPAKAAVGAMKSTGIQFDLLKGPTRDASIGILITAKTN
jgi:hypothetical protein